MKEKLAGISTSIGTVTDDDDGVCTLQQHRQQIADLKKELKEIQSALLDVDLEAGPPLVEIQDAIERVIFEGSLSINKCLRATVVDGASTAPGVHAPGAKLPKLKVLTFNGDILNWKSFWEQFCVFSTRTNKSHQCGEARLHSAFYQR